MFWPRKLNIQAAGILPKVGDQTQSAIFIDGVADSYEIGLQRFKSHYDKAVINKPSRLQGARITIQAPAANDNARIIIGASQLNALNGRIDIKAYGDILLESGENNAYTFLKTKKQKRQRAAQNQVYPQHQPPDYACACRIKQRCRHRPASRRQYRCLFHPFQRTQRQNRLGRQEEELNLLAVEGAAFTSV